MKHLSEEELVLFYYGEVKGAQAIGEHLKTCTSCHAAYEGLQDVLQSVSAPPIPRLEEADARILWNRLRPHLIEQRRSKWTPLLSLRLWSRLAMAGGLGLLLVIAFLTGRYWPRPVPTVPSSVAVLTPAELAEARERVVLNQIGNHLEQAQVTLIQLAHRPTNGQVNIASEQLLARQLIEMNRLCRQSALRLGDSRMAIVLEDLERSLIEIANSPKNLSRMEFAELCRRADSEEMLFKVRVVSADLRDKERHSARGLAARNL